MNKYLGIALFRTIIVHYVMYVHIVDAHLPATLMDKHILFYKKGKYLHFFHLVIIKYNYIFLYQLAFNFTKMQRKSILIVKWLWCAPQKLFSRGINFNNILKYNVLSSNFGGYFKLLSLIKEQHQNFLNNQCNLENNHHFFPWECDAD